MILVKKLIPTVDYYKKIFKYFGLSLIIISVSLAIGMWGYWYFGELNWIDAFLNASMILTGMGPVDHMKTQGGKLFAGIYALYSGIAFLSTAALLLSPAIRRLMHKVHLDLYGEKD